MPRSSPARWQLEDEQFNQMPDLFIVVLEVLRFRRES
jgi:hypothetical protein